VPGLIYAKTGDKPGRKNISTGIKEQSRHVSITKRRSGASIKPVMIAMRKELLKYKLPVCFLVIIFFSTSLFAHTINYSLEKEPTETVLLYYLKLGFSHIIPSGMDHILFVSALCLLSNKIKTILWQPLHFTVAHSVTLALSMKNIIVVPSCYYRTDHRDVYNFCSN
jgi:hypothetical protein